MRILDRYTLKQLTGPLIWCLSLFLMLYLVVDVFGHLDEILRHKIPTNILVEYYGSMLPQIFVQMAPFACLLAVLYSIGNMNKSQEIVAMRASGLGPWPILRPIFATGLLISGLVLVTQEVLLPDATVTTRVLKEEYFHRKPDPNRLARGRRPIESLTVYGGGHNLLYARRFDPVSETLDDVVILEHGKELKLKRKITATKAKWTGEAWRFFNCTILRFGSDGKILGRTTGFKTKIIHAGGSPEELLKADRQNQAMSYRELKEYVQNLAVPGKEMLRRLMVDLHSKLAIPFASIVIILLAVPLAVHSGRGGALKGIGMAIAIALGFYAAQAFMLALGKGGWLPPILAAWGPNLSFGGVGLYLMRKRLA